MFVDTNYFLRYFLADNQLQHDKVKKLFLDAKNEKVKLFTNHIVLFEINWVLTTSYKKAKRDIIVALNTILRLKFITIEEKEVISQALALYEKYTLSLEDCYHLAFACKNNIKRMATFDRSLQKVFSEIEK